MSRTSRRTAADEDLIDVLQELAGHLGLIRQVLDEIFTELQWANQNPREREDSGGYRRITSMPIDPAAPDWGQRVNRFTASDVPVPTEDGSVEVPASRLTDTKPGTLF